MRRAIACIGKVVYGAGSWCRANSIVVMVDPKRIFMQHLSKKQVPRKTVDPKRVLLKVRQAQRRQAALDGAIVADPPFERPHV